jgi:hypothetical protein
MSSPPTATPHPESPPPFRPTEMAQPAAEAFPEPAKPAAVAKTPARAPSSPVSPAKKERVDTTPLEGVRALACAIIAANHWLLWYGEKKHGAIELQGGFAVTIFFFITGFVMYLAYGDKACREDFKYWVRRSVRFRELSATRRVLPPATLPHPDGAVIHSFIPVSRTSRNGDSGRDPFRENASFSLPSFSRPKKTTFD